MNRILYCIMISLSNCCGTLLEQVHERHAVIATAAAAVTVPPPNARNSLPGPQQQHLRESVLAAHLQALECRRVLIVSQAAMPAVSSHNFA